MPKSQSERQIVLASTSRYRAQALKQLGLSFTIAQPNADETPDPGESPATLAVRLATAKALSVAQNLDLDGSQPSAAALIIGSDQVGVCNGQLLHKPGNKANATNQLSSIQGQTAQFFTSVAIYDQLTDKCLTATATTDLRFRHLSDAEIAAYLTFDEPYDCAGSFKAEGLGIALFSEVSSNDPSALIGLPLIATTSLLRECGVNVLVVANPSAP